MAASKVSSWFGLYVTIVISFLSAIVASATGQFSATLEPLSANMGVTESAVAISDSIKSVFIVVGMMTAPHLIKKYGYRTVCVMSFAVFLIPQIAIPFTTSYGLLVGLKIVQAFAVVSFPLMLLIVAECAPPSYIGFAMSILTGMTYAGGALGGSIAGFSASIWSWRASYHIVSVSTAIFSLLLLLTIPLPGKSSEKSGGADAAAAYKRVACGKATWLLVAIFIPTVWTVQAIWADMVPFGQSLGFSGYQVGRVMAISALAIIVASMISGRVSDFAAIRSGDKFKARVGVFSAGMLLIILGVGVMSAIDIAPPNTSAFNFVVFFLSFGAAWGIGSFYSIFPEYFRGDEISAANGFIGGLADVGMSTSPAFMALVGIGMGMWETAWMSCVAVCLLGLFFSALIYRGDWNR